MTNVLRRHFAGLLAGAIAWPFAARAQGNPEAPKVGFIYTGRKQLAASRVDAIMNGLRASGHALPQVEMVMRVTDGDLAKIEPMTAEILARKVSVFLINGPAALKVAQAATRTTPLIVIASETDTVA